MPLVGDRAIGRLRFTGHYTSSFQGKAGDGRSVDFVATDIGGTPARVEVLGDFLRHARQHPGVVFMRKDRIAQLAVSLPDVPVKALCSSARMGPNPSIRSW
ncbi:hypothetical protein LJR039_003774 [Pseudorhodoferax sp. LjRoot39]|uniref:hypothetical protein n=1 Tax=Pseudorhodoferax sp. LjRoot39 TaxID=3342328 RepID=UPI003ED128AA